MFEVDEQTLTIFRKDLVSWFRQVARPMPWRENRDPYVVWVSEIMLQQTRVDQALPYFHRFVAAFPDLETLVRAELDAVLRLWEGLGYYSRARNLVRAAREMATNHNGRFPHEMKKALALPGIGPYSAAAILSIAYGLPYAAVDGNVIRVLSRVFTIDEDPRSTAGKLRIQQTADLLLDPVSPGDFNEALMELGATICTPRSPNCPSCPLRAVCRAAATSTWSSYPALRPRPAIPHYDVAIGILFNDQGHVLIQKRPEEGLLGGLWEFPGGKNEPGESLEETCRREWREELGIDVASWTLFHRLKHTYSHFRITLHAFTARMAVPLIPSAGHREICWVQVEDLVHYAFPRANRKLIDHLVQETRNPALF